MYKYEALKEVFEMDQVPCATQLELILPLLF